MNQQSFGKSGLMTTPIGLGLAALGRPGYINIGHGKDLDHNYQVKVMEATAHAVLQAAWDAGIRYFDAARSYGKAEQFLSTWLKKNNMPAHSVTVGSKWGYTYTADWQVNAEHHEIKEHSLAVLKRQWRESHSYLHPYLDIYQIHSATLDSGVLENQEVLNELARLKGEGLKIGLSLSGPQQAETLRKAMRIQFEGEMLFSAVQATWNVLAQESGNALAEASQAGMGIIVKEALANGRLTARNRDPNFVKQKIYLQQLAEDHQTTIDALAIAIVMQQPWSDIVLSGAATVEHLKSNAAAGNLNLISQTDEILIQLCEIPEKYWAYRSSLEWN